MTVERIKITSREQWLELRGRDVTASAVAATLGLHPYLTPMALWADKSGLDTTEHKPTAVMLRGLAYEPVVAAIAREKRPDWKIIPAGEYLRDPDRRIGATPDFYVEGDARGRGVMQVKTVAPISFKNNWADDVPPFWVQLQTLTECMLDGAAWGVVAAWVLDPFKEPEVQFFDIPRHLGAEMKILAAVDKFWADIAAGREPNPDYSRDAELFAALYPSATPLKTIDLSGDNMLPVLLAERTDLKDRIKADEARCKAIETEVKFKMGDAEVATVGDFAITLKTINRKGYEVAPTSFRQLKITDHRPKEVADFQA